MCGIFCLLIQSLRGSDAVKLILYPLHSKLAHRGPDMSVSPAAQDSLQRVWFSFQRLAINGIDQASSQPLRLGSQLSLVCNGEIFNHHELVQKYGFEPQTHSDCEVILFMYRKFGLQRTLQELEGEFAFCLYDGELDQLVVARDSIGIRPLFWAQNGQKVWFASEAKALKTVAKPKPFPPGSYQVWSVGKVLLDQGTFYQVKANQLAHAPLTDWEQVVRQLRERVIHAVTTRVRNSDRRVGVFLSGGLDSSLVAAIAKQELNHPLHSFAIGLPDSKDLVAARIAAEAIGTVHHEISFTVKEGLAAMSQLIYHLETPDITTIRASLPMYLLSKWIKQNTDITVLLSGEGPDEVWSGYLYNYQRPSVQELDQDAQQRVKQLYLYDVLRADRATAAWSLEVRVPFLDPAIVDLAFSVDPSLRDPVTQGLEKRLLREAAKGFLPDSIRLRPKEAFSDGVGYSWVQGIRAYSARQISDEEWANRTALYPELTPNSKEAYLYRKLYHQHFDELLITQYWLPSWSQATDPSATVLESHKRLHSS